MEYEEYYFFGSSVPSLDDPGTTRFRIAKPQLTIRPIWDYRADNYWDPNNYPFNHIDMPMAYTEIDYNSSEYEDFLGTVDRKVFERKISTQTEVGLFSSRNYFKLFPKKLDGTTDTFTIPTLTGNQRSRVIIDNYSSFYTNGNALANGAKQSPFPARVKINLKLFEILDFTETNLLDYQISTIIVLHSLRNYLWII